MVQIALNHVELNKTVRRIGHMLVATLGHRYALHVAMQGVRLSPVRGALSFLAVLER